FQIFLIHLSCIKAKSTFQTCLLRKIGIHLGSWIIVGEEPDQFRGCLELRNLSFYFIDKFFSDRPGENDTYNVSLESVYWEVRQVGGASVDIFQPSDSLQRDAIRYCIAVLTL